RTIKGTDHGRVWNLRAQSRRTWTVVQRGAAPFNFVGYDHTNQEWQSRPHRRTVWETKEQLRGSHLVDCQDLGEALFIAARIPTLSAGGAIEVRPFESTHENEFSAHG